MSTKKEKCNHDEFSQGQVGEECLECGLLRSTVESIGGHSQSKSIEWKVKVRDWWYSIQDGQKCPDEIKRVEIEHIIVDAIATAVDKAEQEAFKAGFDRGAQEKCTGKH